MAAVAQEPAASAAPDLAALKARQRKTWATGDYAVIGSTLQIVGETLCEALDLRGGERVLDVAAGNGNVALAAARRSCEVVATDYVPALLDNAQRRAVTERLLQIDFQEADAEALPYPDGVFDVVVSTFGVMFVADHARAAAEMLRVCRPGGRIGMANWTPDGFIGQMFRVIGKHLPPPPGARSPALWGTRTTLELLFAPQARSIRAAERMFNFRYRSPRHWLEVFRHWYGPVMKAFDALTPDGQAALERDLLALADTFNRSGDATMVVPGEYLEVIITKK